MSFRSAVVSSVGRKLVAMLSCVVLVACGGDPREHPYSTGGHSLEELLAHFELELPSCDVSDVRYADGGGPMSSGLYLTYGFPDSCLAAVLEANGVETSKKYTQHGRDLPFSPPVVAELGWPIRDDKGYESYEKSSQTGTVHLVIDPSTPRHTVFIQGLGD
jgi:hypothetical protein